MWQKNTPRALQLVELGQDGCWSDALQTISVWKHEQIRAVHRLMSLYRFEQAVHRIALVPFSERQNAKHSGYHLLQTDLVSTVGESVALGAAGIIMWGDALYASSRVSVHMLIIRRNTVFSQT